MRRNRLGQFVRSSRTVRNPMSESERLTKLMLHVASEAYTPEGHRALAAEHHEIARQARRRRDIEASDRHDEMARAHTALASSLSALARDIAKRKASR